MCLAIGAVVQRLPEHSGEGCFTSGIKVQDESSNDISVEHCTVGPGGYSGRQEIRRSMGAVSAAAVDPSP